MKIKSLLIGMLACSALVACTNTDEPEVDNEVKQGSEYYMAVNFSMAGSATSRAFQDGAYEDGGAEINVTSAVFHFLNAAGGACADPCLVTTGLTWTDMNGANSVEKKSSRVIVMRNPTSIPASIIAILNPTDAMKAKSSYAQLTEMSGDYATTALTTSGAFIMSNSVYMNANKEVVVGTPVTNANLYVATGTEPTDAAILAAITPVTIPVEKVVAKVNVTEKAAAEGQTTGVTTSGTGVKLDGATTETTLTVDITGWWLDRTNPNSYLLKQIDANWEGSWWNHEGYKRSYWAKAYTPTAYTHYAYSTATEADKYCMENTNQANHTQVVVAAKLKDAQGNDVSLIKWRNNFYTEEGFKAEFINLAEVQQYYTRTGDAAPYTYETVDEDDLDFTYNTTSNTTGEGLKDYQAQVVLKSGVTVYKKVNGAFGNPETTANVNTVLSGLATVQFWQEGQTYYYTSIKHSDLTEDTDKMAEFGVVRNHLYKLTINSITGLGTPVPNKDLVIVPGNVTDETEYSYIAAEVEVLQYKVVSQDVDLGK